MRGRNSNTGSWSGLERKTLALQGVKVMGLSEDQIFVDKELYEWFLCFFYALLFRGREREKFINGNYCWKNGSHYLTTILYIINYFNQGFA